MLKIFALPGGHTLSPRFSLLWVLLGLFLHLLLLLGFVFLFFWFFFFHYVFCFSQILACRLPSGFRNRRASLTTVQRVDMCPLHGQVCCFCQNKWPGGVFPAMLLHDGRQGGQNPGAAGELWGGGPEQRHWGTGVTRMSICHCIPQTGTYLGIIAAHTTQKYQGHSCFILKLWNGFNIKSLKGFAIECKWI